MTSSGKQDDISLTPEPDATNDSPPLQIASGDIACIQTSLRSFGIRAADTDGQRNSASMLINKMYGWRGYGSNFQIDARPDLMTFVATDFHGGGAIGTMSVGLDGANGLLVDQLYSAESQAMRDEGYRLCEFVKLAVDHSVKSKYLLGALFHVAVIYAYHLQKCELLLIEVNPAHVSFYKRLLHFEVYGEQRDNPRVNAPSVLLRQELAYIANQARIHGGQGDKSKERSIYPFFFSEREEVGIVRRLTEVEL